MVMGGAHITTSGGGTASLTRCSILTVRLGGAGGVGGFSSCRELKISTRPLILNCGGEAPEVVGELIGLI